MKIEGRTEGEREGCSRKKVRNDVVFTLLAKVQKPSPTRQDGPSRFSPIAITPLHQTNFTRLAQCVQTLRSLPPLVQTSQRTAFDRTNDDRLIASGADDLRLRREFSTASFLRRKPVDREPIAMRNHPSSLHTFKRGVWRKMKYIEKDLKMGLCSFSQFNWTTKGPTMVLYSRLSFHFWVCFSDPKLHRSKKKKIGKKERKKKGDPNRTCSFCIPRRLSNHPKLYDFPQEPLVIRNPTKSTKKTV